MWVVYSLALVGACSVAIFVGLGVAVLGCSIKDRRTEEREAAEVTAWLEQMRGTMSGAVDPSDPLTVESWSSSASGC